ncbi:hypothetical protein ANN_15303 [Periplaneta americana]|uniref:Uncharacterized protein n=1 Tax=Periplaneta americana TaxID=6978 RepID=A0ABQ8SG01_PERAM|nr:hypothetical protein ANN_15303 [Periplaneta americana]
MCPCNRGNQTVDHILYESQVLSSEREKLVNRTCSRSSEHEDVILVEMQESGEIEGEQTCSRLQPRRLQNMHRDVKHRCKELVKAFQNKIVSSQFTVRLPLLVLLAHCSSSPCTSNSGLPDASHSPGRCHSYGPTQVNCTSNSSAPDTLHSPGHCHSYGLTQVHCTSNSGPPCSLLSKTALEG